jgi:uncharacterized protein YodC (DUF2158 family)
MAKFAKGEQVKLVAVVPQGPVEKFMMTEDGVIMCLISWVDASGQNQSRWFPEDELVKA